MEIELESQGPKRVRGPQSILRDKELYTPDVRRIASLTEEDAFEYFLKLRYWRTDGRPVCPHENCGHDANTRVRRWNSARTVCRIIFKCKNCHRQFTATCKGALKYRKMPYRDLIMALALFVEGNRGEAALRIWGSWTEVREFRSISNLLNKAREVMSWLTQADDAPFEDEVEADATQVGGYIRPRNFRSEASVSKPGTARKHPWKHYPTGPTKRFVTAIVERSPHGRARVRVMKSEADSPTFIEENVSRNTILYTDKASVYENAGWGVAKHLPVNHSANFWTGESNTNSVECFFSNMKSSGIGVYRGRNTQAATIDLFAEEAAWRWSNRRTPIGDRLRILVGALGLKNQSRFVGLWQRRKKVEN